MAEELIFTVSDFVALVNQTFEYAFPSATIAGELANFRVSRNKWVYFDLKDELASVRFFGTVLALPGPLENGMLLEVRGNPRLHPQFGFSVTVQQMRPVGEGSIKKAANLLEAKLRSEGLFNAERKRPLPYPPKIIGLVTSKESAAYADFIKILDQRWRGVEVRLINVQVQGDAAVGQIVGAIEQFNHMADQPEVLVVVRGGGSADDLQAFSTEQVARAVAASRIPTLVAIGHEVNVSLAELAADQHASTPSNAAELLVPDRREVFARLESEKSDLAQLIHNKLAAEQRVVINEISAITQTVERLYRHAKERHARTIQLLYALSPEAAMRRGYAIVRDANGRLVKSGKAVRVGDIIAVQLSDAVTNAEIIKIR